MAQVSAGFIVSGTIQEDASIVLAIARLKDRLLTRTSLIRGNHTDRYARQLLSGERAMPLQFFVSSLAVVQRLGERKGRGIGREWVRSILSALAAPFGLSVVPNDERPVGDVEKEIREANAECHRAFAAVEDVIVDSVITDDDRVLRVTAHVTKAKKELDDVEAAILNRYQGARR